MEISTFIAGGYRVKNLETFDEKYRCLICDYLLKNPVQLDCGHRICFSCIEDLKKKTNAYQCAACKEITELSKVLSDKGFQKDMFTLDVVCYLCKWRGKLKQYQEHLEQAHREYKCAYCSEIFSSRSFMEEHEKNSCEKVLLSCQLYDFGCETKFLRGERQAHFISEEHQRSVLARLEHFQLENMQTNQRSGGINSDNMDIDVSDHRSIHSITTNRTDVTNKITDEMKNLNEIIDLLSNGVCTLQKALADINMDSSQQMQSVEACEKQVTTVQKSIEESNGVLNAIHTNVSVLQQDLVTLKQRYDEQQITSYNGTLVWKITGIKEKMVDAKSERQVSIYSPAFRSSPTGYKMCARLYLYGDGNARRTHMSLFFVLMRGPHDSILSFPLDKKVTFCLYDLSSSKRHVIDSFRPDIRSSSFQRPRSDMNIASGIPKFIALSMIDIPDSPYIKDDTMFIKIMVDFENTPKTMLPFILSLNPGLPMHVQQRLIREENERRSQ